MKTYQINKFTNWNDTPILNIDVPYLETPSDITASAQISWNENSLLIHLSTRETQIRAEERGELAAPCKDSCLEFFICPMQDDNRYLNIEFNSLGTIFLGIGSSVDSLTRLIIPEGHESTLEPRINKHDDGWEIFYRLPFDFIRRFFPDFEAKEGKIVRANCYKCADLSDPPHYLSWSEVDRERFTFHQPEKFGTMTFKG
ncbi:MAG: hypothetical protein E7592_02160 [Ruminococcaceae bacterium]|nr:hypothetical protein [Oscillospiraceae bacterium]